MHKTILILLAALLAVVPSAWAEDAAEPMPVAAAVTVYRPRSHADVIVSRIFQTDTLDDQGQGVGLKLLSLYADQTPGNDISQSLAQRYGFAVKGTIDQALTMGTDELAVEGVLLVAEHGEYPDSPTGNKQFPKRRMFADIVETFDRTGRVVPVFIDKHVADNWTDIKWIIDQAKQRDIPLMGGSSVPGAWREPAADVHEKKKLEQIVVFSYHTLDAYGFHALELMQALAEQRKGGETGIADVRTLTGDAVWQWMDDAKADWNPELFDKAMAAQPKTRLRGRSVDKAVKDPTLFIVRYQDGLVGYVFTLNGAISNWTAAWQYEGGDQAATWAALQDGQPYYHFQLLLEAAGEMFKTGKPTWPIERTVLTSGALDALLQSKLQDGKVIATPYLDIDYQSQWHWQQPRPAREQHAQPAAESAR